jgi:hypothetical protein
MKKIFTAVVFTLIALGAQGTIHSVGAGQANAVSGPYNPNYVYTGNFVPGYLYYKDDSSDLTWQHNRKLFRMSQVTCADAADHLNRQGFWIGGMDNRSYCKPGVDEEIGKIWAKGNRLNYNEATGENFDQ